MRLVKVDGKNWLAGLQWYVPPFDTSVADIKQYVENEQADCIVRRGIQIGYGSSEGNSDLMNKRSLAAWISIPVNSFVGLFCMVDELTDEPFWWLFARINGNNMSGFGDATFTNLEDAQKAREELLDLLPPNTQIEEEVFCETERESLAWLRPRCEVNFMARVSGQCIVRPISSYRGEKNDISKRLIWLAIAVMVLGGGGYYGYELLTDMGMTSKAREKAAEIQRKRQEIERHPEKIFTQKWHGYPKAGDASMRCIAAAETRNINYAGWQLENIQCAMSDKTGNISLEYAHTPLAAYRFIPEDATFGGKGKKGPKKGEIRQFNVKHPLDWGMASMNGPFYKDLPDKNQLNRIFLELAQSYRVKASVSFAAPEKKTINELGTFTCPWVKGTFTIQGINSIKIVGLCELLNHIPSLAVTRIEYDMNKWLVRGDVYAM